ncbi:hypothetical protein ACFQH2_09295 [Natronoarchaeum sp. GCM10025703]|uniref:hypothetical protein n=1 Tax=Natronoarchaeum sp. GCM10025703 TaxID=3252685 RepID=UPI00362013E2
MSDLGAPSCHPVARSVRSPLALAARLRSEPVADKEDSSDDSREYTGQGDTADEPVGEHSECLPDHTRDYCWMLMKVSGTDRVTDLRWQGGARYLPTDLGSGSYVSSFVVCITKRALI